MVRFHSNYVPKMDFDDAMIKPFIYFIGRAKFTDDPDPVKSNEEFKILPDSNGDF
jgi:hypothetical protein